MVLYYCDLLFGLYPSSLCFAGWFFPRYQVNLLCWVRSWTVRTTPPPLLIISDYFNIVISKYFNVGDLSVLHNYI
jgi:hypothetical protein